MIISEYFTYFIIFSFIGWVYETCYCTIRTKKWDNRGFLYGPICPIYGVGGTLITIVIDIISTKTTNYTWWQIFIIGYFGSIVLEYVTSYTLEKLFHAKWWDYSTQPFNIKGRICLFASIGFGFGGILVVYVIAPFVKKITNSLSPLEYEIVALILMCLISIDITLTISALTHFEKTVVSIETSFNKYMDSFVNTINDKKLPELPNLHNINLPNISLKDLKDNDKEKLFTTYFETSFKEMNWLSRSAIKRIAKFVPTKNENMTKKRELGFKILKQKYKEFSNKNKS